MTRDEADAAAAALKERVGRCERCGWDNINDLQVHEILRGTGLRRLARGKACCSLVLCNSFANGCHDLMGGLSWERQLLILYRSRRDDCDILAFWKIAGRRKPTIENLIEEAMKWGAGNVIKREPSK